MGRTRVTPTKVTAKVRPYEKAQVIFIIIYTPSYQFIREERSTNTKFHVTRPNTKCTTDTAVVISDYTRESGGALYGLEFIYL